MTLEQFYDYLHETVTDEMFEALVLQVVQRFGTVVCQQVEQSAPKVYTILSIRTGEEYSLLINPANEPIDTSIYTEQNSMNAVKNNDNLYFLAIDLYRTSPREVPGCARELCAFVNQFDEPPIKHFQHGCKMYFSKSIERQIEKKDKDLREQWHEAFEEYVTAAIRRLENCDHHFVFDTDWDYNHVEIRFSDGIVSPSAYEISLMHDMLYVKSLDTENSDGYLFYHITDTSTANTFVEKALTFFKK